MQEHKTVPPEEDDAHNLIQEEATNIISSKHRDTLKSEQLFLSWGSLISEQTGIVKISIFTTKELSDSAQPAAISAKKSILNLYYHY